MLECCAYDCRVKCHVIAMLTYFIFFASHFKHRYNIGDALGVFGHNDPEEVDEFIAEFGLTAGDFVSLPHEDGEAELLTVRQLLKTRLDMWGKPSQKFYAALAEHATDTYEEKRLLWLGSEDKEGFRLRQLETVTYADVLREFRSAQPSITELVEMVPPIKPRHYSISSSMKMCPTSVHLLVVEVDWTTPSGRKRVGQCTRCVLRHFHNPHLTLNQPCVCP
jgi:sulfite reductase (NADPH) flavoprotein alpha-component